MKYDDGSRAFYLRRDITAGWGTIRAGAYVRAMSEAPKYPNCYTIWRPGQYGDTNIVGVYRRELRPVKRTRKTKGE